MKLILNILLKVAIIKPLLSSWLDQTKAIFHHWNTPLRGSRRLYDLGVASVRALAWAYFQSVSHPPPPPGEKLRAKHGKERLLCFSPNTPCSSGLCPQKCPSLPCLFKTLKATKTLKTVGEQFSCVSALSGTASASVVLQRNSLPDLPGLNYNDREC